METIIMTTSYFEMEISIEALEACYHAGDCYQDCVDYSEKVDFPERPLMVEYLRDTGAWTLDELTDMDEADLQIKVLWLMAGDYHDDIEQRNLDID